MSLAFPFPNSTSQPLIFNHSRLKEKRERQLILELDRHQNRISTSGSDLLPQISTWLMINRPFNLEMKELKKSQKVSDETDDAEILKAVAQAWYGHSGSSKAANTPSEFDAHRNCFTGKPTRFKLEAMRGGTKRDFRGTSWDFGKSLWDSYEIVAVSKKLETGLIMNGTFSELNAAEKVVRRQRESRNSLRSLLSRASSRRFSEA